VQQTTRTVSSRRGEAGTYGEIRTTIRAMLGTIGVWKKGKEKRKTGGTTLRGDVRFDRWCAGVLQKEKHRKREKEKKQKETSGL